MAIEQSPDFPHNSGDSVVNDLPFPDTVLRLVNQANRARRKLFDAVHQELSELPYNPPEDIRRVAITAFHRAVTKSEDGATWERNAIIARRRHEALHTFAWHILINDFSHTETGTVLNYAEYVLPIGRRIMDFRYNDTVMDRGRPTAADLEGIAYIQRKADGFSVFRGKGSHLLAPPLHWNITVAPERFVVHDELEWLLKGLREMAALNSFEEGVMGAL